MAEGYWDLLGRRRPEIPHRDPLPPSDIGRAAPTPLGEGQAYQEAESTSIVP